MIFINIFISNRKKSLSIQKGVELLHFTNSLKWMLFSFCCYWCRDILILIFIYFWHLRCVQNRSKSKRIIFTKYNYYRLLPYMVVLKSCQHNMTKSLRLYFSRIWIPYILFSKHILLHHICVLILCLFHIIIFNISNHISVESFHQKIFW